MFLVEVTVEPHFGVRLGILYIVTEVCDVTLFLEYMIDT